MRNWGPSSNLYHWSFLFSKWQGQNLSAGSELKPHDQPTTLYYCLSLETTACMCVGGRESDIDRYREGGKEIEIRKGRDALPTFIAI